MSRRGCSSEEERMPSTTRLQYCYPTRQLICTIHWLEAAVHGLHCVLVARELAQQINSYRLHNIGTKCDRIEIQWNCS